MTTRAPGAARSRASSASSIDQRDLAGQQSDARADQRRAAAREDKLLGEIYDQGRKDARSAPRARRAGRARSGAGRSARRVGRTVTAPTRRAARSGGQLLGMGLVLVALYLALTNAGTFARFIGGIGTALRWLASPSESIRYAG